jgi:hypothetical protein
MPKCRSMSEAEGRTHVRSRGDLRAGRGSPEPRAERQMAGTPKCRSMWEAEGRTRVRARRDLRTGGGSRAGAGIAIVVAALAIWSFAAAAAEQ